MKTPDRQSQRSRWRQGMNRMLAAALLLALAASIGLTSLPAAAAPASDVLLDVPFYSQYDSRWRDVAVGYNQDVKMKTMGSLLTAVAMVANYHGLQSTRPDGFVSPEYINAFLFQRNGYRPSPARTVIMDYDALVRGALYSIAAVPAGLILVPEPWPAAREIIDNDLDPATFLGGPSILILQLAPNRFHPVVVVGWHAETESYYVIDPAWSAAQLAPFEPVPMRGLYGSGWESFVAGALIPRLRFYLSDTPGPGDDNLIPYPLISASTKSPVETIGFDPDGRRVGFDVATGTTVVDVAGASYLPQPVWADPTGAEPPRAPGRLLNIPGAAPGRYRYQMIATGDGPFTLSVRARNATGDLVVDQFVVGHRHDG